MPSLDSLKDNVPFAWRHARSWLIDLTEELIAISGGTPTTNYVSLTGQGSAPSNPAAGDYRLYITTTNLVRFVDSGGTVRELMDLSSTQTATGAKTFTDTLTLNSAAGSPILDIRGAAGTTRNIVFKTATANRWIINTNSSGETGSNAGSNLTIIRYDDAGSVIDTVFTLTRSSAAVTWGSASFNITNAANIACSLISSGAGSFFSASGIAGTNRSLILRTSNSLRWHIAANTTAEGGSDAGSNLEIHRYSDAGASLGSVLVITRSDGTVQWNTTTFVINASSGNPLLEIRGVAATTRNIVFKTGSVNRWVVQANNAAESGSNAGSDFAIQRYDDSGVGIGAVVTITRSTGVIRHEARTATTGASITAISHYHNSTGTPGPGMGIIFLLGGETDTTENQSMFQIDSKWVVATHASRTARAIFSVFDTAAREAFRIEASGTAAMIGFLGANAITRPTVLGSRGGNAALASLLTALANLGLITDSTSA